MNVYDNRMNYLKFNNGMNRNKELYIRLNLMDNNNNMRGYNQRYTNNSLANKKKNIYFDLDNNEPIRNTNYMKYKTNSSFEQNLSENDRFNQIKEDIQKLSNKIQKLNNIIYKSKEKNNQTNTSFLNKNFYSTTNDLNNIKKNKILYKNNVNFKKMNKTNKINNNNNINNNLYPTFDLNNLKNVNKSKSFIGHRKFSTKKNDLDLLYKINRPLKKNKNYAYSYKSNWENDFNINNNDISNYQNYKAKSLYKGNNVNEKYLDINELDIDNSEDDYINYNQFNNKIPFNKNQNKSKYILYKYQLNDEDYNISKDEDIENNSKNNNKIININNKENKSFHNNYANNSKPKILNNNTKLLNNKNNDSEELSDLADELVEAFNFGKNEDEEDTQNIFNEEIRRKINEEELNINHNNIDNIGNNYIKSKSNNINYNTNNNFIINFSESYIENGDLNNNKKIQKNKSLTKINENNFNFISTIPSNKNNQNKNINISLDIINKNKYSNNINDFKNNINEEQKDIIVKDREQIINQINNDINNVKIINIDEKNNENIFSNNLEINTKNDKDYLDINEIEEIDNSLIHDSELNIELIIETLKYNKVIQPNKEKEEKIENININNDKKYDKNQNMPIKIEDFKKFCKNDNKEIIENKDIEENIVKREKEEITDIMDIKIDDNNIHINKAEQNIIKQTNVTNKNQNNNINNINGNTIKIEEENKIEDIKTDLKEDIKEQNISKENVNSPIKKEESKEKENTHSNKKNDEIDIKKSLNESQKEEFFVNQILQNIEIQEKSKRSRHITFKLDNNVHIKYKTDELITDFEVTKQGEEDIIPFKRDFNLYLKILKRNVPPNPIIKKYDKNEIKVNKDYKLMENLDEQEIIPDLYEENEEDIKSLEKSLERSIDKSFDKSYERSVNMSINQSYNQSINQSYNQSITQSYMENNSFLRTSSKLGASTGGGLIQKLNKVFNEGISEDKEEFEENEKEENNENEETNKEEEINQIKDENGNEENEEEDKSDNEKDEEKENEDKSDNEKDEEENENKDDNEEENKENGNEEEENLNDDEEQDNNEEQNDFEDEEQEQQDQENE